MSFPETEISTVKASLLFENLLDLQQRIDKKNKEFPEEIQDLMDDFLDAQEIFIAGVDRFMHRNDWHDFDDLAEDQIVETIIESCPEFLSMEDEEHGELPIHIALRPTNSVAVFRLSAPTFIPMLAQAGYQHGVGGEEGRGGLLIPNSDNETALEIIASYDTSQTMKLLMQTHPPLFTAKDVRQYNLLHLAVKGANSVENVKFYADLDPSCLLQKDDDGDGNYPLYHAWEFNITQYILKRTIKYDYKSVGKLFTRTATEKGLLLLDVICEKIGEEVTWDCIQKALSLVGGEDVPILHYTIIHAPTHIKHVLKRFPNSIHVYDPRTNNNRLPIHLALERGVEYSDELVEIMNANKFCMEDKDPVTDLYPFALAASGPDYDLSSIYHLLLNSVTYICN